MKPKKSSLIEKPWRVRLDCERLTEIKNKTIKRLKL